MRKTTNWKNSRSTYHQQCTHMIFYFMTIVGEELPIVTQPPNTTARTRPTTPTTTAPFAVSYPIYLPTLESQESKFYNPQEFLATQQVHVINLINAQHSGQKLKSRLKHCVEASSNKSFHSRQFRVEQNNQNFHLLPANQLKYHQFFAQLTCIYFSLQNYYLTNRSVTSQTYN